MNVLLSLLGFLGIVGIALLGIIGSGLLAARRMAEISQPDPRTDPTERNTES